MADGSLPPLVTTFIGERYQDVGKTGELIAPPYDVITTEQRRIYRERNQHNIVRLILPAGNGDRYTHAATILTSWRTQGVLAKDDEPSVYVVRQEFSTPDGAQRVRTGVIGAVAVEPYSHGRIRPHEKTHRGPKEDRLALMKATRAMFEALLMMSRDSDGALLEELRSATEGEPEVEARLAGARISLWRVSGQAGESITAAASGGDGLYIADGHHRYETAETYRGMVPEADRTLGLIVPVGDPGLEVLPTHRVIHGDQVDQPALMSRLEPVFDVTTLASTHDAEAHLGAPDGQARCVVYLPGPQYLGLRLKEGIELSHLPHTEESTVTDLAVAKIDSLVVEQIRAMSLTAGKLSYSPSAKDAIQRVYSEGAAGAVLVSPTTVEQVLAVSDAGGFMPQKSTYFDPKVPSGLVVLGW
jgi:uncharacterized protein (DUF1015 family)